MHAIADEFERLVVDAPNDEVGVLEFAGDAKGGGSSWEFRRARAVARDRGHLEIVDRRRRRLGVDLDRCGTFDFFADEIVERELDRVAARAGKFVRDSGLVGREGFEGGTVAEIPPALGAAGGAVVERGGDAFDGRRKIRHRPGRLDGVIDERRHVHDDRPGEGADNR